MLSEHKLAANRRNALHSTGPRTSAGKARVRHNALNHGLLAKDAVITSAEARESRAEFRRLHAALTEDLQPVGPLEELLVEKITLCHWRLRRAVRFEAAEIRRSYGVPPVEGADPSDHLSARLVALLPTLPTLRDLPDGASPTLTRTSSGIDQLLKLVADACFALEAAGQLTEAKLERLLNAYGKDEGSVGHICFVYNYWLTDRDKITIEDRRRAAGGPSPEECRAFMLFTLDSERRRLSSLRRKVVKREALERERQAAERDLDRACLALPPEAATDRLLRYETAIERQLYKALAELDRLQRRRSPALVPPPVAQPSPN